MPAGYDFEGPDLSPQASQSPALDPGVEDRFQQFIAEGGSPGSRLRDAFAQLLARGQGGAVPMEAVMAAQFANQVPQAPSGPAPNMNYTLSDRGQTGDFMAMPKMPPQDPNTTFPELKVPNPMSPPPQQQGLGDMSQLFPGARSVKIMPQQKRGTYALPGS